MIIKFENSYEVSCRFLIRNYVELVKNSILRNVNHGRGLATTDLNMPFPASFVIASGTNNNNVYNIISPPFDKVRENTFVPIRNIVNNRVFNPIYEQISLELNNGQRIIEQEIPNIPIGFMGTSR